MPFSLPYSYSSDSPLGEVFGFRLLVYDFSSLLSPSHSLAYICADLALPFLLLSLPTRPVGEMACMRMRKHRRNGPSTNSFLLLIESELNHRGKKENELEEETNGPQSVHAIHSFSSSL